MTVAEHVYQVEQSLMALYREHGLLPAELVLSIDPYEPVTSRWRIASYEEGLELAGADASNPAA